MINVTALKTELNNMEISTKIATFAIFVLCFTCTYFFLNKCQKKKQKVENGQHDNNFLRINHESTAKKKIKNKAKKSKEESWVKTTNQNLLDNLDFLQ